MDKLIYIMGPFLDEIQGIQARRSTGLSIEVHYVETMSIYIFMTPDTNRTDCHCFNLSTKYTSCFAVPDAMLCQPNLEDHMVPF